MRMQIAALLVLASCTTTMRVSREDLQDDVARRFPREIDKRVVVVRASEPQIEFPGAPDVLGLRLHVDVALASGRSQLAGTARVEGRLDYVASEHAFYLREPRVTELELDAPEGTRHLSRAVAREAIVELLRDHPLYRLDARRSEREAKAIRHLRSAHIRGQDLVLTVGW